MVERLPFILNSKSYYIQKCFDEDLKHRDTCTTVAQTVTPRLSWLTSMLSTTGCGLVPSSSSFLSLCFLHYASDIVTTVQSYLFECSEQISKRSVNVSEQITEQ